MTGGKAAEMTQRHADNSVIAVLTPICIDNFRHAGNADGNLAKLNAIN
jgi:hypothetical protein